MIKPYVLEKYINWNVDRFFNPYKIDPQGYCPVQAEGYLPSGEWYYFRARHSSWSIEIGNPAIYRKWETYRAKDHDAGGMPRYTAILLVTKAIKEYYTGI